MRTLTKRLSRRKKRISANIVGTKDIPRISIFRSNKYLFAQVIDDSSEKTVASIHTKKLESKNNVKKSDASFEAGKELASLMKSKKIEKAVVDRGRFHYQGRVQKFVEGVREGGIQI